MLLINGGQSSVRNNQARMDDKTGEITIEGLLTHASGLPRESDHPYWTGPDFPFPTRDQIIERIQSAGKHHLIVFSGELILRTHMRMNGSWHIYRPGERWQRPPREMRVSSK